MPRGVPNEKPVEVEHVEPEAPEAEEVEEVEPVEDERREVFEATRPDGTVVVVSRNIDTGEQTVTEK